MPKKSKRTPEQEFSYLVNRVYRARGNNTAEVAAVFNVSRRTAQRWIQKLGEGQREFTTAKLAEFYTTSSLDTPRYLRGDLGELKEINSKSGPNFIMKDYLIEPGKTIPKNDVTDNPYGYQIIIQGKSAGKKRNVTTSIAGDMRTAMLAAAKEMSKYNKFRGGKMIIRVFSRA